MSDEIEYNRNNVARFMNEQGRLYDDRMFWGRVPSLTIADPKILKDILVKEFSAFTNLRVRRDVTSAGKFVF